MASEFQEPIALQTLSLRGEYSNSTNAVVITRTSSTRNGHEIQQGESSTPGYEGLSLPPVDGGFAAWSFVFAGFMLEALVWGFGFTYGVFQEYFLHHHTFGNASEAEIGAVGTVALAIQYFEALFVNMIAQQWPHRTRLMMWSSLGLCCGSLLLASFATQVSHLILLQGILFGIGGGGLYAPVIIYGARQLSEWFTTRRGLAAAIIFGGAGAGGTCFPIAANLLLSHLGFRHMDTQNLGWVHAAVWSSRARVHTTPFTYHSPAELRQTEPVDKVHTAALGILEEPSIYLYDFNEHHPGAGILPRFSVYVGQIIFGHACDVAPYQYVIFVSGAGASLSAYLLWGFAHSLGLIFAFVIIFGSLSGGFASVWPAASVDIAGSEQSVFLNAYGLLTMGKGVAAIVGPLMAAALYHPEQAAVRNTYSGYGFKDVTVFVGTMMAATAAGGVATKWVKRVA